MSWSVTGVTLPRPLLGLAPPLLVGPAPPLGRAGRDGPTYRRVGTLTQHVVGAVSSRPEPRRPRPLAAVSGRGTR